MVSDDKYLIDVFIWVDEEIQLLEEMVEIEKFCERVLVHYENGEFDKEAVMIKEIYVIKEDEENPSQGYYVNMGDEELLNEDMLEVISILIENIMPKI